MTGGERLTTNASAKGDWFVAAWQPDEVADAKGSVTRGATGYWLSSAFGNVGFGVLLIATLNYFFPPLFVGGNT